MILTFMKLILILHANFLEETSTEKLYPYNAIGVNLNYEGYLTDINFTTYILPQHIKSTNINQGTASCSYNKYSMTKKIICTSIFSLQLSYVKL